SVFVVVIFGTYVGIGALAHDLGFDVVWAMLTTVLVWAAPGQVILISGLGAVRLLPMVVAMLPILRRPGLPTWQLILPAHFTAISVWVEGLRLLPGEDRRHRVAFYNGLACGFMAVPALAGTVVGFYLAAGLPPLLAGGLLFLTPLSFLLS